MQLEIDTFSRSIPTANFGGQTWRGPSWVNSEFNDSVATMYPDVLAFPLVLIFGTGKMVGFILKMF